MKVLILGSGVIGVASAYYLQRAGHEVTVIDRAPAVAQETSYANGGQVSWSAAVPWAAPGIPLTALKWLLRRHSPLVLRPRLDPAMWTWLARMLGNCSAQRFAINRERMLRVASYSHRLLTELRAETGIRYHDSQLGTLVLYRDEKSLAAALPDNALLDRFGIPHRPLDRAACVERVPALAAVAGKIAGGVLYPGDESGDCRLFSEILAARAQAGGVQFDFSTQIHALTGAHNRIDGVMTSRGQLTADAYVMACGSYSPLLLRPLGMRLPIYPVKGYSLTLPITNSASAPAGTVTDEEYKVVITRLGDRLRAAGTAELTGYDLRLPQPRLATLTHVVRDLFPEAGDLSRAEYWAGLRPMTPDNPPVLGATRYKNLFLNTGHGTLGWTMACGSGKIVADLISGREPEISLDGLGIARYR